MNTSERYMEQQLALLRPDYAGWFRGLVRDCLSPQNVLRSEATLDRFAALLPDGLSTPVRLALIYDTLRSYITYDRTANAAKYTYIAALFRGQAVCMGIAELLNQICRRASLDCRVIIGFAGKDRSDGGGLHAWNIVRLTADDGRLQNYHCDLTWDLGGGSRRFFLKSDEYMRSHDHYWHENEYPICPRNAEHTPKIPEKGVEFACLGLKRAIHSSC